MGTAHVLIILAVDEIEDLVLGKGQLIISILRSIVVDRLYDADIGHGAGRLSGCLESGSWITVGDDTPVGACR